MIIYWTRSRLKNPLRSNGNFDISFVLAKYFLQDRHFIQLNGGK